MRIVDYEKLNAIAAERREDFLAAKPFAHIVLDDFLYPEAADALLSEFGMIGSGRITTITMNARWGLQTSRRSGTKPN